MTKKLRAFGGDIFAGLFTVGVQRAGFDIVGHVEHSNYGHATCRLNFPNLPLHVGIENWPEPKSLGKIDFMFTNPPCAAWSSARGAGQGTWRDHHDRLRFIENLATYGVELQPKAWAWESVTNAWRHGREFIDRIANVWLTAGYSVTIVKQNNMYLGVPQNRPRVLVVAHKHPLAFPALLEPITAHTALKGIKPTAAELREAALKESWRDMWERSAEVGGNMRRIFERLSAKEQKAIEGRPSFMDSRINPHKPMAVNLDRRKRLHWKEPRMLTWAEGIAVCGLPPTWKHAGSMQQGFIELSRAVMPGVGQWLATAVSNGLILRQLKLPTYRLYDCSGGPGKIEAHELVCEPPAEKMAPWRMGGNERSPKPLAPIKALVEAVKDSGWKPIRPVVTPNDAPRKPGSGARIRELLVAGKPTDVILATIKKEFPASKATANDVAWNRRRLKGAV